MSKMGGPSNPELNIVITQFFNFICFLRPTPLDPDPAGSKWRKVVTRIRMRIRNIIDADPQQWLQPS